MLGDGEGESPSLTINGLLLGNELRFLLNVLGLFPPHGIVTNVYPLGHAPLDSFDDGTGGVE